MKASGQLDLITKGARFLDRKKYMKAYNSFYKSLQKDEGYNAVALFFMATIKEKALDYIMALKFLRDAITYMSKPNNKTSKSYFHKIYAKIGYICLSLGLIKDSVTYNYKAYNLCNIPETKANIFIANLFCLTATNTPSDKLLKVINQYDTIAKLSRNDLIECTKKYNLNIGDKIHVAYISPDFRMHVMYKFYFSFLQAYDKDKFFVTCIYLSDKHDEATEAVRNMTNYFLDASNIKLNKLAGILKSLRIDIAVDLAGHSANSGLALFGYRIAPVQISGLGWMETTGFGDVDYLITDKYMDPLGTSYIIEKPLYLKTCFCYTPKYGLPCSEGAPCLKNKYITFSSFNKLGKLTDDMILIWKNIMDLVPGSQLLLKCKEVANELTKEFVLEKLAKFGMDTNRIHLEKATLDYMERYFDVDIALDTYPYTGGGTTFDALYMGVPVVSLYGERRSSRFGLSILTNAGVGELAVPTVKEYIERAVALANDWELLDVLHKNLRTMLENSPAMDAKGYVREIEGKYKEILSKAHKHDVFD